MGNRREELTLSEKHNASLELLCEFVEICREYNLRYDLCGGTLLGAVRHHGFIPWDDDVDVCMPRPDYERLIELKLSGKLKLSDKIEFVCSRDNTLARQFGRYIRKDISYERNMSEDYDSPFYGMDIFIVDGIPQNNVLFNIHLFFLRQIRRFMLTSIQKSGTTRKGELARIIKDSYRPILKKIGPYRLARQMDSLCKLYSFDRCKYVGCVSGMYGKREKWLKTDMMPQMSLPFENKQFMSFEKCDIYLGNLYGEYMKLPPKEKQLPHGAPAFWKE